MNERSIQAPGHQHLLTAFKQMSFRSVRVLSGQTLTWDLCEKLLYEEINTKVNYVSHFSLIKTSPTRTCSLLFFTMLLALWSQGDLGEGFLTLGWNGDICVHEDEWSGSKPRVFTTNCRETELVYHSMRFWGTVLLLLKWSLRVSVFLYICD